MFTMSIMYKQVNYVHTLTQGQLCTHAKQGQLCTHTKQGQLCTHTK